ncbi:acyltransferase [Escherichia coli]|uniref:acyltransferase n=1 Tax=Escherichia coli TaxID=562 RepID=UPI0007742460|nr:hypothetical protein AXH19_02695 [Escherichia coli]
MLKQRNLGIEALRIFSFIMVVTIHTAPEYSIGGNNNITALILQSLSRGGFICFFIISGYFALNDNIKDIKKYYYNKMITIVFPFIIYAYIHYFMVHNNFGTSLELWKNFISFDELKSFVNAIMIGPSFNGPKFMSLHFWFVYWIVGAFIVSPFIAYIVNLIPSEKRMSAIFVLISLNMFHLYITRYIPKANIIFLPYIVNGWFLYFLIGGLLNGIKVTNPIKTPMLMFMSGYILTIIITVLNYNVLGIKKMPYGEDINMILMATGLFIMFYNSNIKWPASLTLVISRHSYSMYLCHVFILYFISGLLKPVTDIYFINIIFKILTVSILSFIFAYLVDTFIVFKATRFFKQLYK